MTTPTPTLTRFASTAALKLSLAATLSLPLWALAAAPVAAPAPAAPPATAVTLVPAQSEISFVAKQLGVPLAGRFKRFTVQSNFNPKSPQTSQIAFAIELGSASVSAEADWFNVPKFPQASFQSTAIKALGGGKFEVAGKLAIKGNARDLVVPMQLTQAGALSTATGGFTLKRLDFKVGDGEWTDTSIVANEVQVKFKIVLQGVPAQ
jgi:polyisoprenoid-binding protein YceI